MMTLVRIQNLLLFFLSLFLLGCASIEGSKLKTGQDGEAEIEKALGKPAMRWQAQDGSVQLAYPNREQGRTLILKLGADGKLQSMQNNLEATRFALIHAGMTQEQVLLILGSPDPNLTIAFPQRNELTWGWIFHELGEPGYFFVSFDTTKGTVRSTMIAPFRVLIDAS